MCKYIEAVTVKCPAKYMSMDVRRKGKGGKGSAKAKLLKVAIKKIALPIIKDLIAELTGKSETSDLPDGPGKCVQESQCKSVDEDAGAYRVCGAVRLGEITLTAFAALTISYIL